MRQLLLLTFTLLFTGVANAAAVSGQGTWETTLLARDLDGDTSTIEAYYDTTQEITWLADANYAQTSGFDSDGRMWWNLAISWAANLSIGGYSGWRLPETVDVGNDGKTGSLYDGVDWGYNMTTHSEMSYLFHETLGNTSYYNTNGGWTGCNPCLANTGPFSNIQQYGYWSATTYAPSNSDKWFFRFSNGDQNAGPSTDHWYAWAVHDGDIGTAVVPLPATAWFFLSALSGLFLAIKDPS